MHQLQGVMDVSLCVHVCVFASVCRDIAFLYRMAQQQQQPKLHKGATMGAGAKAKTPTKQQTGEQEKDNERKEMERGDIDMVQGVQGERIGIIAVPLGSLTRSGGLMSTHIGGWRHIPTQHNTSFVCLSAHRRLAPPDQTVGPDQHSASKDAITSTTSNIISRGTTAATTTAASRADQHL